MFKTDDSTWAVNRIGNDQAQRAILPLGRPLCGRIHSSLGSRLYEWPIGRGAEGGRSAGGGGGDSSVLFKLVLVHQSYAVNMILEEVGEVIFL